MIGGLSIGRGGGGTSHFAFSDLFFCKNSYLIKRGGSKDVICVWQFFFFLQNLFLKKEGGSPAIHSVLGSTIQLIFSNIPYWAISFLLVGLFSRMFLHFKTDRKFIRLQDIDLFFPGIRTHLTMHTLCKNICSTLKGIFFQKKEREKERHHLSLYFYKSILLFFPVQYCGTLGAYLAEVDDEAEQVKEEK